MRLNIYYSANLKNLTKFQDFFINNYFFKDGNILNRRLFDVYFFDIESYTSHKASIDVILIDDYLVNELYKNEALQKMVLDRWKSNKRVVFVGLSESCTRLSIWSEKVNFIRAFNQTDLFDFLYTELTHDILKILINKKKLQVFISHAKKDGRDIAKLIKTFIDGDVKLGNFFDETDIQSSESWKKSLRKNVKNSLFLFVYSDSYAHTIWTQQEIIWAKEERRPIVGIDVLTKEDKRVFPYMGNIKMVKLLHRVKEIEHLCDNSFSIQTDYNLRLIINDLLKETLKHYMFVEKHKGKKEFLLLSRPPELFDLSTKHTKILYPDPPIILIEEKILKKYLKDKKILTPLLLKKSKVKKKVAISISESPDLKEKGLTPYHLNRLMVELARYLLIQNSTLLYGGDLGYRDEFNFTKRLVELQKSYNSNYRKNKKIINYAVRPFSDFIDVTITNLYAKKIDFRVVGEECKLSDIETITKNLTEMKEKITNEMDMRVSVGGKITGFAGLYPGILEEVYLAVKNDKPLYLIGSFGGITEKIIDLLEGKEVKELTFEYQSKYTEKLRNFLLNASQSKKAEIEDKYSEINNLLRGEAKQSKKIFIEKSGSFDEIISFVIGK